ncbi:MAG: Ig-like domain-containing protein [Candidatus Dormibacteria bacterium]
MPRHTWWPVILGTACIALAACSPSHGTSSPTPAGRTTPSGQVVDAGPPSLTVSPTDGSTGVGLDAALQVAAVNATVSSVSVEENDAPASLTWAVAQSGDDWTYAGGLDVGASYTVTATAVNAAGGETVATSSFQTITSAKRLLTSVEGLTNGETVGIGMPVELQFNVPIPAADQQAIVDHIAVVSNPPQPGAWYWYDSRDVHYRPENFWESGTQVTVDADLNGVDAGNGYWGLGDWTLNFSIGAAHLTVVNTQTRQMQVYDGDSTSDGTLLHTWSTNTGKPGFLTIGGTLVVLYHDPVVKMQSCPTFETPAACTPGGSEYYDENVYDDTAVSSDGYFIHAAPWVCGTDAPVCDLWPYGNTNSSHGCINLSTDNAVTYYNWSQVGDPVEVLASTLQASYSDGEGDWQTPYDQMVQGGADVPASAAAPASAPASSTPAPSASAIAGP